MITEEKLKKKLEEIKKISEDDPLMAGHAYLILAQSVSIEKDEDLRYADLAAQEAKKLVERKDLLHAGELFQSVGIYLRSRAKHKQ